MDNTNQSPQPTLQGFLEYVQAQPSDKPIDHSSWYTCATGEYLKSIYFPVPQFMPYWLETDGDSSHLGEFLDNWGRVWRDSVLIAHVDIGIYGLLNQAILDGSYKPSFYNKV